MLKCRIRTTRNYHWRFLKISLTGACAQQLLVISVLPYLWEALLAYLYLWRHSSGAGWAGITNWVDHFSDGGIPGSAALRKLTRKFHPAISPSSVHESLWENPFSVYSTSLATTDERASRDWTNWCITHHRSKWVSHYHLRFMRRSDSGWLAYCCISIVDVAKSTPKVVQ